MNKMVRRSVVFALGGLCYGALELLWRGRTHWSMIIAGGICLVILFEIYTFDKNMKIWKRGLVGAAVITSVEFVFGCVFNYWLKMGIWDYSKEWLNIMGQICPWYSLLWGILSIPVSFVCIKISDSYG